MAIICLIDNSEHESIEKMHSHLRKFKIKQESYYKEYMPREDLLTGEPIPFKNYEQYTSQDFIDKRHMAKWLKENPEEGKEWAIKWLLKRKEEKQLEYAPSFAELKSLAGPSMEFFDSVGGYYQITESIGFKKRYSNEILSFKKLPKDAFIIQDTREQNPLKLSIKTKSEKVNEGDYAVCAAHDKGIRIERKSLQDAVGTLNARKIERKGGDDSALERFDRELARAKEANLYVVMLVESTINDALNFNYLPQMRFTKATSAHVWHNLRTMLNKYPLNFQVLFADGRVDASSKLIKLFEMGEQVKRVDLQYHLDKGDL